MRRAKLEWARRGGRPWPKRRNGLRARLTRLFALVALLAVGLTSFLTFTAGFQLIARLQIAQMGTLTSGDSASAFPWSRLTPQQRAAYAVSGREAGRSLGRAAVFAALLSGLLAVGVAAFATRSLTRPLARLADGARRLERGERGWRLQVPDRQDELRDLTLAFNASLDSLERQEHWRRALVADVAHDLRTPLSVLRAEIEAMQDGVRRPDEAGLARLHGEVLLLSRLVGDLRTLSLAESGALALHPERIDVADVLRELASAFAVRAEASGHHVQAMPGAVPLPLTTDPARLRQVLYQLIDNALRYTPGGAITLSARRQQGEVQVSVQDEGPGLSSEARERAFERFYRADAARSRDASGWAGSGLGLAIVRAVVEAQGGRVEVVNVPQGGARFTLFFPDAPSGA